MNNILKISFCLKIEDKGTHIRVTTQKIMQKTT